MSTAASTIVLLLLLCCFLCCTVNMVWGNDEEAKSQSMIIEQQDVGNGNDLKHSSNSRGGAAPAACSSVCFTANWRRGGAPAEQRDGEVIFDGHVENEYEKNTTEQQQQQQQGGAPSARAVLCRGSNLHQLPCRADWPVKVCCSVEPVVHTYRSRQVSSQQTTASRSNSGGGGSADPLRWSCRIEFDKQQGKIPADIFGEDARVTCRQNGTLLAKSLPDVAHVRTRRSSVPWGEFLSKLHGAEDFLADASHEAGTLLVVRDEASPSAPCYRFVPRGESCYVTISVHNHDRQLVFVSLCLLIGMLIVALFALCCRGSTPQRRARSVTQALDELEEAALQKAFDETVRMKSREEEQRGNGAAARRAQQQDQRRPPSVTIHHPHHPHHQQRQHDHHRESNNENDHDEGDDDNNNNYFPDSAVDGDARICTDSYPVDEIIM